MQAVNQALGIKADKVFENAKKIGDISSKLMESGIGGGVGATALGKYARKGISKFNQFKQDATDKLDEVGASKVVLFCVEEKPEACHRSIVTNKLEKIGYKITHL